nr:N-acetylmuramoyl-L-alanine amidase [Tsuneonella rigui]
MMDELVHRTVPSPNWDERKLPISMVVLHYTEMASADDALARLTDPEAKVSAHYLISEAGEVIRLVDEDKRAWHAGLSYWRGHPDVNSASIGIELDHPGHALGYREFSEAQFAALVPLLARIVQQYDVPRANVVGHSDVAPARKIDPGELFPWDRLAEYKLCLARPDKLEQGDPFDNDAAFYLALERFGYDITDGHKAVEAFQRRWRPEKIDGQVDGQVRAILFQLLLDRDQGRAR